jgi:hypothetical protein
MTETLNANPAAVAPAGPVPMAGRTSVAAPIPAIPDDLEPAAAALALLGSLLGTEEIVR